jgi:hypothetical protein
MGNVKLIIVLLMISCLTLQAQQRKDQTGDKATQQLKAAQQSANSTDQDGDSLENAAANAQGTADTPGATEAAVDANNNNDGDPGNDASPARASNTPAVSQTSSSASGSPAVLSKDDGRGRDGTNNVQRATMNMAGSPANNIRVNNSKDTNPDSEMNDRQNYEQAKQTSAQDQKGENANPAARESNEINNNSRRENNAASDQNLSSKEKNTAEQNGEKKSRKKARRKKDRG